MKYIVILCETRTGSNFLCEILHQFKSLRSLNEIFILPTNNDEIPHSKTFDAVEKQYLFNRFSIENNNIVELAEKFYQTPKSTLDLVDKIIPGYKVIKLHNFIFRNLKLDFLLEDSECGFILLNRTSKIKQYVSGEIAKKILKHSQINTSQEKVIIDPKEFLQFKKDSDSWYNEISQLLNSKNYLKINYETDLRDLDDSASYDAIFNKIKNWLHFYNIPAIHRKMNSAMVFKKQNYSPLEEQIINYQEIKNLIGESDEQ